jgi:glucan phosphoethanolaminetransferase (alkaline phosphatase superfamily)
MRTAPLHARPIEVLMVAAWFGMLTGFCEVLLRGIARFLLHRYIHLGPSVVWMAPLADLLLFAALGLLLLLLARRWPRVASLPSVLFVFVFIGSISLLLLVAGLHRAGAVLLSAGLATQASRLLAARAASFLSLVRHTAAWMVVLLGGLAIGIQGWQALGERFALANLPAASSGAPNVLLIVLDTVRAPSLSLYGYERPTTPELERLAARGVRFERALSTSPWTLPSHASMFTGHFPHELSADWETSLDETYPTLAEVLASQGYVTAGFVANVRYCSEESGLNRGFAHYEDHPVSPEQVIKSSSLGRALIANAHLRRFLGSYDIFGRKSAPDVNAAFLRWLSRNERRPFFAFLN